MVELSLVCPQAQVGPVCDLLEASGSQSISVEDADAGNDAETALFGEPGMPAPAQGWQRSRLCALFASEDQARKAWRRMSRRAAPKANSAARSAQGSPVNRCLNPKDWGEHCGLIGVQELAEQDWVRLTQAQFAPVPITEDFWVVPSWHEAPAQAKKVLRLDPGLAFGTGTHPTTRMCLRWIARHTGLDGKRVLDYGCGSGILAIAAALHGAQGIDAVDIDPAALDAARQNAQDNKAHLRCGLPDIAKGVYGLVVANILAAPLQVLAPLLCRHVAPGGSLLLSGILERQASTLIAAYQAHTDLRVVDAQEGWVLMLGGS